MTFEESREDIVCPFNEANVAVRGSATALGLVACLAVMCVTEYVNVKDHHLTAGIANAIMYAAAIGAFTSTGSSCGCGPFSVTLPPFMLSLTTAPIFVLHYSCNKSLTSTQFVWGELEYIFISIFFE